MELFESEVFKTSERVDFLAALAENWSSVPSTHAVTYSHLSLHRQGIHCLLLISLEKLKELKKEKE